MSLFLSEIIISTYNSSAYIRECLLSILPQLDEDIRLYIIDDCSEDDTVQIIESLIKSYSRNLSFVTFACNQHNYGLTYNLNHYLSKKRSKYVFRMDSDDISHHPISDQLNFNLANPAFDIIGGQAFLIDRYSDIVGSKEKPLSHKDIVNSLYMNPFIHSSVLFKTDSIIDVGNYDLSCRHGQDYELWFRCAKAGLIFCNMDKVLVYLRKSSRSKYPIESYKREFNIAFRGCIDCSQPPIAFLMICLRLVYSILHVIITSHYK